MPKTSFCDLTGEDVEALNHLSMPPSDGLPYYVDLPSGEAVLMRAPPVRLRQDWEAH